MLNTKTDFLTNKIDGFTLIELTVVITILSIITLAFMISFSKTVINLNAQAELLASDIRYTQNLAITHGQRYRFVLNSPSANSYRILNENGTVENLAYGASSASLGSGISFGAITNLPNSLINFDTLGIPYTDTASPGNKLNTTATISITSGGTTKILSITPQTGRVIIQ